jgi:tryptophan synthase beta chain
MNSKFFFPALPGQFPNGKGYFGAFGGKFIPEALVAAVDEVAIEYERAKADPGFAAELEQLLAHYAGRPTALTEVPRAGGVSK